MPLKNRRIFATHGQVLSINTMHGSINFHKMVHLNVHKIENFFDSDFGICIISLLVMSKY